MDLARRLEWQSFVSRADEIVAAAPPGLARVDAMTGANIAFFQKDPRLELLAVEAIAQHRRFRTLIAQLEYVPFAPARRFRDALVQGVATIHAARTPSLVAYRAGGLATLQALRAAGHIDARIVTAFERLDAGDLEEGNLLLMRVELDVIVPTFWARHPRFSRLMSRLGSLNVSGQKGGTRHFSRDVPGGRFDDVEDRLRWDRETLLPELRRFIGAHPDEAERLWQEILDRGTRAGGRYDLIA